MMARRKSFGQLPEVPPSATASQGTRSVDKSALTSAESVESFKLYLHQVLVNHLLKKPSVVGFARGVAVFYIRTILNIMVIAVAVLDAKWDLAVTVFIGIVAPGIIHCINMYYIVKIMNPKVSRRKQIYEATLALFSLNRAVEAWRYRKDTSQVKMGLVIKDYLGNLTLGSLPAISGSIKALIRGDVEPGPERIVLVSHAIVCSFLAAVSLKMLHTVTGPPSFMEKYRFWNLDSRPLSHIAMALLIDASQILYRLLMFALIGAYAGFEMELAMVFGYVFVSAGYFKVGLSLMAAYDNSSNLMSWISGIENVIYDYGWLERVPVYSFYAEASFQLRMVQLAIGAMIIYGTWDNGAHFDNAAVRVVLGACIISAAAYIATYLYYVFYLMRHRVAAVNVLRDKFVSEQFLKRHDRKQECNGATNQVPTNAGVGGVAAATAPPMVPAQLGVGGAAQPTAPSKDASVHSVASSLRKSGVAQATVPIKESSEQSLARSLRKSGIAQATVVINVDTQTGSGATEAKLQISLVENSEHGESVSPEDIVPDEADAEDHQLPEARIAIDDSRLVDL